MAAGNSLLAQHPINACMHPQEPNKINRGVTCIIWPRSTGQYKGRKGM